MSVIEGIGDEVVLLALVICIFALIALAWWSTGVRAYGSSSSVWYVQMQTYPQRRVLQVVHVDEAAAEHLENQANTTTLRVSVPEDQASQEEEPLSPGPSEGSSGVLSRGASEDTDHQSSEAESDKSEEGVANTESENVSNDPGNETSKKTNGEDAHSNGPSTSGGDTQIRLKFLDETQKMVGTFLTKTVREFKSQHFGSEVDAGKVIRLIYQGQLLRDDNRSLASYGLSDNCIVHCHVSATPLENSSSSSNRTSSGVGQPRLRHGGSGRGGGAQSGPHLFDNNNNRGDMGGGLQPGRYAYSLFALIFIGLWSIYTFYPTLFQFPALLTLIICTAVFFAMWIRDQLGTIAARARVETPTEAMRRHNREHHAHVD